MCTSLQQHPLGTDLPRPGQAQLTVKPKQRRKSSGDDVSAGSVQESHAPQLLNGATHDWHAATSQPPAPPCKPSAGVQNGKKQHKNGYHPPSDTSAWPAIPHAPSRPATPPVLPQPGTPPLPPRSATPSAMQLPSSPGPGKQQHAPSQSDTLIQGSTQAGVSQSREDVRVCESGRQSPEPNAWHHKEPACQPTFQPSGHPGGNQGGFSQAQGQWQTAQGPLSGNGTKGARGGSTGLIGNQIVQQNGQSRGALRATLTNLPSVGVGGTGNAKQNTWVVRQGNGLHHGGGRGNGRNSIDDTMYTYSR